MLNIKSLIIIIFVILTSCDNVIEQEQRAPLGEVWLNLDGSLYEYGSIGKFPEDDNGYVEKAQFLSIIRKRQGEDFNSVIIRASAFNLEQNTPFVFDNASVTINFPNGQQLEGKDGQISLTVTDKSDDILTGVFKGRVRNVDYAVENYAVSGSFKIQIERF